MKLFLLAVLSAFALGANLPSATTAADTADQFVAAQAQFELGLRGSEKDNKQAVAKFRALTEVEPDNPLYLAYYGSAITIQGRDALMPWKKMKLGETGLDFIDKALGKLEARHDAQLMPGGVPLSIEARLVAITTFLQMPNKYFHRLDRGRTLLAQTMKSEVFAKSPAFIQARYWFQAAVVARSDKHKDEETAALKRVTELDPQGIDVPAALKRSKELGQ
jgi:tetratricopeptide (TPR) repeat protein